MSKLTEIEGAYIAPFFGVNVLDSLKETLSSLKTSMPDAILQRAAPLLGDEAPIIGINIFRNPHGDATRVFILM